MSAATELPDAEATLLALAERMRGAVAHDAAFVGIYSGGAWLAERLQRDLHLPGAHGVISSALHRDDFRSRGLVASADTTKLPFGVEGRAIVLIDDVLFTGRTIRAVLNELYDFGRPASVKLAVLVDRGGRELPIEAGACGARLSLPAGQQVKLRGPEPLRLELVERA